MQQVTIELFIYIQLFNMFFFSKLISLYDWVFLIPNKIIGYNV